MIKFEDKTAVDFVIVGAGGAGGVMAKEPSTAGFQVVVLEQGPCLHEDSLDHDELKFKDVFDPPPSIGQEAFTNDHFLQPNTYRKSASEKAVLMPFTQYGRCVGGGTVHFTGNSWRLHEINFQECSRRGAVQGAALADWPITYPELEPYYRKRMGARHLRAAGIKPLRASAREALPPFSNAREVLRCAPGTGSTQTGTAPVSGTVGGLVQAL